MHYWLVPLVFCGGFDGACWGRWGQQTCTPDEEIISVSVDSDGNLIYSQPGEIDNDIGEECCDGTVNGNVDCVAVSFNLTGTGIDEDCLYSSVNFLNDQGNIYVGFVDDMNNCSEITEYGNNELVSLSSCEGGSQSIVICKPGFLSLSPNVLVDFKCEVTLVPPTGQTICEVSEIPAAASITSTADFLATGGDYSVTNLQPSCGACNVVDGDLTNWMVMDDNQIIDPCDGGIYVRTYSAQYCGVTLSVDQVFTIEPNEAPILTVAGNDMDFTEPDFGCVPEGFTIPDPETDFTVSDDCPIPGVLTPDDVDVDEFWSYRFRE